jgi:hypothetical protein
MYKVLGKEEKRVDSDRIIEVPPGAAGKGGCELREYASTTLGSRGLARRLG